MLIFSFSECSCILEVAEIVKLQKRAKADSGFNALVNVLSLLSFYERSFCIV